jgi:hypothetical protein
VLLGGYAGSLFGVGLEGEGGGKRVEKREGSDDQSVHVRGSSRSSAANAVWREG